MKKLLLTFFAIAVSVIYVAAQGGRSESGSISNSHGKEQKFQKIRPHFKVPGQYYDRIEFWSEQTGQLIKSVDLEKMHPFNSLPFPSIDGPYGSKQYDLSKADMAELHDKIGIWTVPESIADPVPVYADGQIMVFDGPTMEHFTVAAYNLYLSNRYRQIVAILGVFYIFNDQGEIVSEIKTSRGGSTPVVTQDGKYLAVKYGGAYGECGSGPLPEGVLFFESKSSQIILDFRGDDSWSYGLSIGEAYNRVLGAVYIGGNVQPNRHWVFDMDREKLYYVELFEKKKENRPVWTNDGAIFTKHGVRREFLFEQDFKITTLEIEKQ